MRFPLTNSVYRIGLALLAVSAASAAAQIPATQPAPADARPMLDELNRETQALYREVKTGVVRVQLPQPRWMAAYAFAPMNRWEKLDPDIRRRLVEMNPVQRPKVDPPAFGASAGVASTTRPAPEPPDPAQRIEKRGTVIFVPSLLQNLIEPSVPLEPVLGARLADQGPSVASFAPNNLGMVLDDAGHVLVPLYLEPDAVGKSLVSVSLGDGKMAEARFVGSDRQTNLSLLRLMQPQGMPVRLATERPADGALVLYISPLDASGRLALWDGGQKEYGIVFRIDGSVAGIARFGQFLSGSSCRLIAQQLIRHGAVKRATLGVIISEIRKDDSLRERLAALGKHNAVRVDEVMAGSAAQKGGLKAGDCLLALAAEPVGDIPSFAAAIAARSGITELQILRDGQVVNLSVDLEQQK